MMTKCLQQFDSSFSGKFFSGNKWSYGNARLIEDVRIEHIYQLFLKSCPLKPKLILT